MGGEEGERSKSREGVGGGSTRKEGDEEEGKDFGTPLSLLIASPSFPRKRPARP